MNCPQCADFLTNSEKYAIEKISGEISSLADKFAQEKAPLGDLYIDHYMMYYRIEYTRLYNLRKAAVVNEYNALISSKHLGSSQLCVNCKTEYHYNFNEDVKFCFHITDFESNCENCISKTPKQE
jgi:hypothetical protein